MKKTLIFLTLALFATAFIKAGDDVNLGDFEDGTTNIWMLYGESYEIVNNPLVADPNTSTKALQNITISQYQGISLHDLSYALDSFVLFSFDIYDATGAVDFIVNVHGKTDDGSDVTVSYYPTTTAGAWLHYEVDLTHADYETMDTIAQLDLQNNTAETELYWDNILLTGAGGGSTNLIGTDTDNSNNLLFYPNPVHNSDLISFAKDVENNSAIIIYNVSGQLILSTYLNDRMLNISSLNSGLYFVNVGNKVAKLVIR